MKTLLFCLLALTFSVHAQEATRNDEVQDVATAAAYDAAVESAAAKAAVLATAAALDRAQSADNTQRIEAAERMSASQNFVLQILMIIMPLLTLMGTTAVAYMHMRARAKTEVMAVEQRKDLAAIAVSINGVKSELIAATQARAFYEARTLELERQLNPGTASKIEARSVEISEEARLASVSATATSDAVSMSLSADKGMAYQADVVDEAKEKAK